MIVSHYIPYLQRVGGDDGREDLVPVADDLPQLGLARDAVARRQLEHPRPPDREVHLGEGGGGAELMGSLKLGNVWVFEQLIHRPTRTKNQL